MPQLFYLLHRSCCHFVPLLFPLFAVSSYSLVKSADVSLTESHPLFSQLLPIVSGPVFSPLHRKKSLSKGWSVPVLAYARQELGPQVATHVLCKPSAASVILPSSPLLCSATQRVHSLLSFKSRINLMRPFLSALQTPP